MRDQRDKKLISEADFKMAMDRLTAEQHDQQTDIEIKYADKEAAAKEELAKIQLETEAEQKKLLKQRQTQEKMLIFHRMLENVGEESRAVQQYLQKANSDAEKELHAFSRQADRDMQKALEGIEGQKQKKVEEMIKQ